jgi:hypothetical protein
MIPELLLLNPTMTVSVVSNAPRMSIVCFPSP